MSVARRLLCWPCVAVGIGMVLAGHVSANDASAAAGVPYWRDVAMGAIGLVMVLSGFFLRSLDGRLVKAETGLSDTRELILRDYRSKDESNAAISQALKPLEQQMDHVEEKIDALHARMDQLQIPHARAGTIGG